MDNKDYIMRNAAEDCPAGLHVTRPKAGELLLDIDSSDDFILFEIRLGEINTIVDKPWSFDTKPSKSGFPKVHVTVQTHLALTDLERIALQQALGSDRVREFLSIQRVLVDCPDPTVFFDLPT